MADKSGPRSLIVAHVGDTDIRLAVLERRGEKSALTQPTIITHDDPSTVFENPAFLAQLQQLNTITPYISIVMGGGETMIRLMILSGAPDTEGKVAQRVRQTLGVNEDFDVIHQIIEQTDKNHTILTTAFPRRLVDELDKAVIKCGLVPVSLVHTGTALTNLSILGKTIFDSEGNTAILHVDIESSILAVRVNQQTVMVRQLKQGLRPVYKCITESYGLDEDMAVKLFNSGSFDISGQTNKAMSGWFHQVEMSLDFVARRLGGRVNKLFLSGSSLGIGVLCENFAAILSRPVEIIPNLPDISWPAPDTPGDSQPPMAPYLIAATEGARVLHAHGGHE